MGSGVTRVGWWRAVLIAPLVMAAFAFSRCDTAELGPVGYGVLEFGSHTGSDAVDNQQVLGLNILYTWAELEPNEGVYDWGDIDEALAVAEAKRVRIAPRVYTNLGDFGQSTPGWVFDAGAASYQVEPGAEEPQPVPTDGVFTAKFGAFLKAFGARYDGNPWIEFIQTNAGMGTYGEMVWGFPEEYRPDGWSAGVQIDTTLYWIDRWREAFPHTPLVLMQNYLGHGIAEAATEHAVSRGFYLQANDPWHSDDSQAILARYDERTKIVMEVEDRGCRSATGTAFDEMIAEVFDGGFEIDYLTVCGDSLDDAGRLAWAIENLRKQPKD